MYELDVSISITSWNRKELTKYCIDSILKYTPPRFELIVVDNQSEDGAKEMLKNMKSSGKINKFIINRKDTRLGTAINLAWSHANSKAKILITFSNDHFVMKEWLENLLITMEDLKLDYALAHLGMPGFNPNRKALKTTNGGKYFKKEGFIFGGGLAIRKNLVDKKNIRFPETDINSPFSIICKELWSKKFKGIKMAKPTSLQQDCRWNDPNYQEYYERIFCSNRYYDGRRNKSKLDVLKKRGYTPFVKEYYKGTNYLQEIGKNENYKN